MKRQLTIFLAIGIVLGLFAGCGNTAASTKSAETAAESVAIQQEASIEETQSNVDTETTTTDVPAESGVATDDLLEASNQDDYFPLEETVSFTCVMKVSPNVAGFVDSVEDLLTISYICESLNVYLDMWIWNFSNASESFQLMLASGDYCDLLQNVPTMYSGGLDAAVEDGLVIPLNDHLEEWSPNYWNLINSSEANKRAMMTDNGYYTTYSLCYSDDATPDYGPAIRADWLEALGLSKPETYDDYYNVLTAFKSEYGAQLWLNSLGIQFGNYLCAGFDAAAFYEGGRTPFLQIDGTIEYGPAQEGFKDYVTLINQWYSEGLIYDDAFAGDYNQEVGTDLVLNGEVGVFYMTNSNYTSIEESASDGLRIEGIQDAVKNEGNVNHIGNDSTGGENQAGGLTTCQLGFTISDKCTDVETAMRFLDYFYSDEGNFINNWGLEGITYEIGEDGQPQLTELITNNPDLTFRVAKTIYLGFDNVGYQPIERDNAVYNDVQLEAAQLWAKPDYTYMIPDAVSMNAEENEAYARVYSDVSTYVSEMLLKFITGAVSIEDNWDIYLSTLDQMGLQTCIDSMQGALDRYYAK